MKFLEAMPGVLVVVLRLALVPVAGWMTDWISVLALLWIAIALTPEDSRSRRWSMALGCLWLAVIYGVHQAPWTFAAYR